MWSPETSSRRSGWCSTTWDGAWPGVSCTCQRPRSVSTSTPGSRWRSGSTSSATPLPLALARLAGALHRLRGHAAVQGHLHPPLHLGVGVLHHAAHVLVVGVHPQLAARGLDHRRGQPVVVGVGVGAHQQPHVVQPQPRLVQRPLQLPERPGLVHAAVEQHHAAARGHRVGVAVGHAGPGQRQAKAPDAGQHPVRPGQLASLGPVAHRRALSHGRRGRSRSPRD